MSLPTQPYKGARDFYPEDKRLQKYLFSVLRKVVEGFGYQEYDAPIIEPLEIYLTKTSEEIVTEQTYSFIDRGGRNVTIRPEMTPSVSRMVAARRQELAYPVRWYSIPNLWRYERPQHGRLREHWQLNVDLFGIAGVEGDFEVIQVADALMQAFKAPRDAYTIRINSRKLFNYIVHEHMGLQIEQGQALARLIDKRSKINGIEFKQHLAYLIGEERVDKAIGLLACKKLEDLPMDFQNHPSVEQMSKLFKLLHDLHINNAIFDLEVMRGFDYYTDIVFEVFDNHPDNNRAMFGGGRYDGLVAEFGVPAVPTVGFGMGDVTLQNFLEGHNLLPDLATDTDAVVILVGDVFEKVQKILAELRSEGLKLAVDVTQRKLDAKIKSAVKSGVPYVVFIGEKELANEQFKLKELDSGEEQELSLARLVSTLAARRRPAADDI